MNANWPEITSNLLPGQTAYDRPELCCRVFNMKLEEIMAELKSCKVFGPYMAHLGVIEFQKRCYPHAHLVYTFTSQGPQHMNEMDKWVWARIPAGKSFKVYDPQAMRSFSTSLIRRLSRQNVITIHIYGPTRYHSCIGLLRIRVHTQALVYQKTCTSRLLYVEVDS